VVSTALRLSGLPLATPVVNSPDPHLNARQHPCKHPTSTKGGDYHVARPWGGYDGIDRRHPDIWSYWARGNSLGYGST